MSDHEKNRLRLQLSSKESGAGRGVLAEILRGAPSYRAARTVFVSPSPLLGQVRINVLADGKTLLAPSPGLKEGFHLLAGTRVPRGRLAYAATPAGMAELGQRLDIEFPERFLVDLLVHEVLAVDRQGYHLGDGQGFFDLSMAILATAGGLAEGWQAVAVTAGHGLYEQDLPREPWDMPVHAALAGDGMHFFGQAIREPVLLWQHLPRKRIRKMTPLWKLFRRMDGKTREDDNLPS